MGELPGMEKIINQIEPFVSNGNGWKRLNNDK
jgi:hypothetical protein